MGKVGETVKHPATWVKIAKAICKPPAVPVALRIAAAISAYPSARSDRKRGLAKLRLDDGPLRRCGIRPGRHLQHCRTLAFAKMRDQHNLAVGNSSASWWSPAQENPAGACPAGVTHSMYTQAPMDRQRAYLAGVHCFINRIWDPGLHLVGACHKHRQKDEPDEVPPSYEVQLQHARLLIRA